MSAPLEDAKGKEFPFLGKDLVLERTAVGSKGVSEEWSDEGLSAADRKVDQLVQQH